MPSSAGANIPRRFPAVLLGALSLMLALIGLGDTAFGGDAGALTAIARRPAAARLLAEATRAPVVDEGAGFSLVARARAAAPGRFHAVARGLSVHLPRDAGGRIEIGVPGEARRVGVRRAFATAAAGRLALGALVYPAAAPGLDAVWFARGDEAEELLVVRAGAAAIAYDLDLPAGSTLIAPPGFPGLVEVRDARGSAWLRMTADAAWDARGRPVPIAVRVDGARVWIDVPAAAERPLVVDPTWFGAGRMAFGRAGHTATLLGSGQVLIAGGRADAPAKGDTAELFDPSTGRFTASATTMKAPRAQHSATLLGDGNVLLVGGLADAGATQTAELFDPTSASFSTIFSSVAARTQHTATLLEDGHVLLVGGEPSNTSADLYDAATRKFLPLGAMTQHSRSGHTATPLGDGRVLLVGGFDVLPKDSIEIFNPAPPGFVATTFLTASHAEHTTTRLRDGLVLIAGGEAGGTSAELFDPDGARATTTAPMHARRAAHTATLLPSGQVLLVGGAGNAGYTAEIFDPAERKFTWAQAPSRPRFGGQTATLLPSGDVLIVGGYASEDDQSTAADVEIYSPSASEYPPTATPMTAARVHHTATRLRSGQVLFVGGLVGGADQAVAEMYDPTTDRFAPIDAMSLLNLTDHSATRLLTGQVLVVGGIRDMTTVLTEASIYDPETGFRSTTSSMATPRRNHAATLLPSGEVLISGGLNGAGVPTPYCEIYNFDQDRFRSTTNRLTVARASHTATVLPSGEVLIVGGTSSAETGPHSLDDLGSAELYNPVSGEFRLTGALVGPLPPVGQATATLLPSGEVLILGKGTPELYDPAAGSFRVNVNASGSAPALFGHTATLLPSGRVLITGGFQIDPTEPLLSPLIYAPISGELTTAPDDQARVRSFASATLLASGEALIAGGDRDNSVTIATARRWREARSALVQPQITGAQATVNAGQTTTITGEFGALDLDIGGGTSGSATSSPPIAVWMPDVGGAVVGGVAAWSPTTAAWTAPYGGLVGRGLLFVSAHGTLSPGIDVRVMAGPACSSNLDCGAGQACSAEGRCVDPVDAGAPPSGCGIARAGARGSSGASAWLFVVVVVVVVVSRRGRGTPTARDRAARCSRRRRARRAPARRRA
jgi:hypothetical protein